MKLWNPTKESIEFKYDMRTFIMLPGTMLNVSDQMMTNCMRDFAHLGVVSLRDDASQDEKEKQRLSGNNAILDFYWQQLLDWNSHSDDKRNNGQSIVGEPRRVKDLKRKIAALEESLGLEKRMSPEIYAEINAANNASNVIPIVSKKQKFGRPRKVKHVDSGATQIQSSL